MIRPMCAQGVVEPLERRKLFASGPASVLVAADVTDNAVVEVTMDSKILVARDGFLHRYLRDLTPDPSFGGGDGVIELAGQRFPTRIVDIKLTPAGKVLLAGQSTGGGAAGTDLTVAQLNPDGSPDASFGGSAKGYANTAAGIAWADFGAADEAHALAVAPDGRIAIVGDDGKSSAVVAVFDANGALDTDFDTDGKLIWAAKTITTTSEAGKAFDGFYGRAAGFAPDGRLIVGGFAENGINLNPGFNIDFSPDRNWLVKSLSTSGAINWSVTQLTGITEQGRVADLAVLADGSILAAGTDNQFMRVARFDRDGALITSFGENGISLTPLDNPGAGGERGASRIIARSDGSFDLLGHDGATPRISSTVYLGRFNADGAIDTSFGNAALGGLRVVSRGPSTIYAADFTLVGNDAEPAVLINDAPLGSSAARMRLTYTSPSGPATAFIDARGSLKILGSDFDDTIHVHRRTDGRTVVVLNGVTRSFPTQRIRRIHIYGFGGNDTLTAGRRAGNIYVDGGNGDDSITGQSGDDFLEGGAGEDVIIGNAGNDILAGGRGDDVLQGNAGNDILYGQAGFDYLRGGAGDDSLFGQGTVDTLWGDEGDDFLDGGADTHDNIYGGAGGDTAVGDDKDSVFDVELMHDVIQT